MSLPLHAGLNLPLAPDVALGVIAVGVAVLAVAAYDAYRSYDGPQRDEAGEYR